MQALCIDQPGSFRLVEAERPHAGDNQVVVKIKAATLCNQHDIKVWTGSYQQLAYLEYGVPGFPGHEASGEVVEVGPGVSTIRIGDHVVLSGLGGPPVYQHYVLRDATQVVPFSQSLDFDLLAMSELLGCVHRGVKKIDNWTGKKVLVAGLGPAGLGAGQIIKAYGAEQVIGTDKNKDRLNVARHLSFDRVCDVNEKHYSDFSANFAPDIVYETTGNPDSIALSIQIARQAVVLFGYTEKPFLVDPYPLFDHELSIVGSKWLTASDLAAVVSLVEQGAVDTRRLVTHTLAFSQYPEAIELVQCGKAIKVILKPDED